MFISDFSGKNSDPGVCPVKIVTHKRTRVYNAVDDRGYQYEAGRGWEIVKEISVLPEEVKAVKEKYGDGVFVDVKAGGFSGIIGR